MLASSQIPPENTSYYLKYTWEAISKGVIQIFFVGVIAPLQDLAQWLHHYPFRATKIG